VCASLTTHSHSPWIGDQFNKYFTDINPNSKIPALEDTEGPGEASINVFESANIGLYLCEKHGGRFWFGHLPESDKTRLRVEGMNWIFFQMANQGPLTGQFGHYFVYAPAKGNDNARTYGTARYGMEVLRICDVMEKHLAAGGGLSWFVGGEYSLVDMVLYPWFKQLRTGYPRGDGLTAGAFLGVEEKFPQLVRWANAIADRDAVKRAYAPAYNNLPEEFKKWA
jgi:GST-like protein